MKLIKRRLIKRLFLLTTMLTIVGTSVAFAGNSSFTLTVTAGAASKYTGAVQKDDLDSAVVNVKTGILLDHVTFRVRTSDGSYATDYIDAYSHGKYYLAYYSPSCSQYRLYASYDSGQWRSGTTVTGIWAP